MSAAAAKPVAVQEPEAQTGEVHDAINAAQPKALAIAAPAAQAVAAWNQAAFEAFCATYMPGATVAEVALFEEVCRRTGLSPYARQLYPIKRRVQEKGNWVERWSFQVSIDGFRLIAERTGAYRGQTTPLFCGADGVWKELWLSNEPPIAAKVGVLRSDFDAPLYAIAKWSEYAQRTRDGSLTSMWAKMGSLMLAKVAEALALRKAFPQELSGLYTTEEMAQADNGNAGARAAATTQDGALAYGGEQRPVDPFAALDPEALTLEQAQALPLFGGAGKWDGNAGKLLRDVPSKVLASVLTWLGDKLDIDDNRPANDREKLPSAKRHQWVVTEAAIEVILEAGKLPLTGDSAARPTTESATPGASTAAGSPTGTTSETDARAREKAEADKSMVDLHRELKAVMDDELMPTVAREYFSWRIRNNRLGTPTAIKQAIAMAKICVQIGDACQGATDKERKEVETLLKSSTSFQPAVLTGIRDNLVGGRS